MRATRMSAPSINNLRSMRADRPPGRRSGGIRANKKGGSVRGTRLRGLRWVPMPLALLAALLGLLVAGAMQGQAAANRTAEGEQLSGLSLNVDTMLWMMNPMDEMAAPAGQSAKGGYSMPNSMMPGMQPTGDNRLRVEVDLRNVSNGPQRYSTTDFSLIGRDGKTWQVNNQDHSSQPATANLEPGYGTTIDMYFDMPAKESKNLTLKWSRGGSTLSIPVNTGGAGPSVMHM